MGAREFVVTPPHGIDGMRLGSEREAIVAWLRSEQLAYDEDPKDPSWLDLVDHAIELRFDPDTLRLTHLLGSEEAIRGERGPLVGVSLPAALRSLPTLAGDDMLWRLEGDPERAAREEPAPEAHGLHRGRDVPAEQLLDRGTLWLPPLGIGLRLEAGRVAEVILAAREHLPRRGDGPLTHEQRELAEDPNLPALLRRAAPRRGSRLARLATVFLVLALAGLGWRVWREGERIAAAPTVPGKVVAREPAAEPAGEEIYVVRYRDRQGKEHEIRLGLRELYVPREIGEEVQISYFPEAPERGFGPAHGRDGPFLPFMPWFLAVCGAYVVALMIAQALRR